MQVILLKDIEKLGRKDELITVRDGFARNFLLPRAFAVHATRENRKSVETKKELEVRRKNRRKEEAERLAERLGSFRLSLEVSTGEKDKLFGSVTAQDIADAFKRQGIVIDKKQIRLPELIRSLGTHPVTIELETDVKPTVQVEIVKSKKK